MSDKLSSESLISVSNLLHHFTLKSLVWSLLVTRLNSTSCSFTWWKLLKLSSVSQLPPCAGNTERKSDCCSGPQGKIMRIYREARNIDSLRLDWSIPAGIRQMNRTSHFLNKEKKTWGIKEELFTFWNHFPHFLPVCAGRKGSHPQCWLRFKPTEDCRQTCVTWQLIYSVTSSKCYWWASEVTNQCTNQTENTAHTAANTAGHGHMLLEQTPSVLLLWHLL